MRNGSTLLADFILMADSKQLRTMDGDPMAVEALLRDVFGIVVDEAIRKGTSASEKVGSVSSLLLPAICKLDLSSPLSLVYLMIGTLSPMSFVSPCLDTLVKTPWTCCNCKLLMPCICYMMARSQPGV